MVGDLFEAERPRLLGLAYRMLGTMVDAEDVIQDVWLRWQNSDLVSIEHPAAWLTTLTTRTAIDHLRSRRRHRERECYVGPWLPEPIVTEPGPETSAELADSLTLGFLIMLDRLSPLERAVLLLADVFSTPYSDLAEVVGRSEVACRQIASRARRRLQRGSVRRPRADERRVVDELLSALAAGDVKTLLARLAPDVVLISDGGATRRAARYPVVGADRVARFMANLARRQLGNAAVCSVSVNGDPGFLVRFAGTVDYVIAFEVNDQQVSTVWIMSNPDKLGHMEDAAAIV